MMNARRAICAALWLTALVAPIGAQELTLPGNAVMTSDTVQERASHAMPIGAWRDGTLPTREVTGTITRQAWRLDGASATTLQLAEQIEAQLKAAGFVTLLRCAAAECGGFDFRFALSVLPPPEMFVDLFDYRFISAHKPSESAGADAFATALISRSGSNSYVQITRIAPDGAAGASTAPPGRPDASGPPVTPAPDAAPLLQVLTERGHAVLRDLEFATGADTLGPGPFASLEALAAFLGSGSGRRIALVGHTDTVGGLSGNLALSRRRAQAVMQRLVQAHGVAASQLEADGIAYLSPIAPNTTEAGREANRRVEAVLLAIE